MMSVIRKITGTTGGDTPVFDGTMRGALVALLNAAIGLAVISNWLDEAQAIYLALMVNPAVFFLFGLWDAFWKARTKQQKRESDYREIVATVAKPTVGEAMKAARLPQDSRITPAVGKKKQPRDAGGRFGSKPKRKR